MSEPSSRRPKQPEKQQEKLKLAEEIAQRGKQVSRTYARFEVGIIRFVRFISSIFDRLLFSNRYTFVSSLVLAIILVFALQYGSSQMLTTSKSAETIEDIKVQVIVNSEIYEISGIPEIVSALIIGDISDLQLIQASNNLQVVADLSGLGEGTHQIALRQVNYSARVQVKVDPATTLVTIERKISKSFYFTFEFINTDKADPIYNLGYPTFASDQVFVRAAPSTLEEISQIKALIDVTGVAGDFTQEARLVAFDQQGNRLEVDIIPSTVGVSVPVSTPNKTVAIQIQPIGEIPNNQSISSITLDHQSIVIYGPNVVLDKIESVVIPLDVSKLSEDNTQGSASVVLPSGIKKSDIDKVHFTIRLGATIQKTIGDINLEFINFDDKYKIAPGNPLDYNVSVVISGTAENIEKITAAQLHAYLDLATIKPGKLSLPVLVYGPNYLVRYAPVKETIDIEVSER